MLARYALRLAKAEKRCTHNRLNKLQNYLLTESGAAIYPESTKRTLTPIF